MTATLLSLFILGVIATVSCTPYEYGNNYYSYRMPGSLMDRYGEDFEKYQTCFLNVYIDHKEKIMELRPYFIKLQEVLTDLEDEDFDIDDYKETFFNLKVKFLDVLNDVKGDMSKCFDGEADEFIDLAIDFIGEFLDFIGNFNEEQLGYFQSFEQIQQCAFYSRQKLAECFNEVSLDFLNNNEEPLEDYICSIHLIEKTHKCTDHSFNQCTPNASKSYKLIYDFLFDFIQKKLGCKGTQPIVFHVGGNFI